MGRTTFNRGAKFEVFCPAREKNPWTKVWHGTGNLEVALHATAEGEAGSVRPF